MRGGVAVAALIGGFVAATTLPAAAQYVGWSDRNGGVGVGIGVGSPGVYGAYAADYPAAYYGGPTAAYAYSAPAACPCATAAYGSGRYGAYGYAGSYGVGPGESYGYGRSYAYGPSYAYATYGVREGVRSRGVTRYARTDVGDQTIS